MPEGGSEHIFNSIASIYNLFYGWQRKKFRQTIDLARERVDLGRFETALDIGSGTGALAGVLKDRGIAVTGIEPAGRMLEMARRRPTHQGIAFLRLNALTALPFPDKSFDLCIASHVAHGLRKEDRLRLYAQMNRLARQKVILHDYNQNRSPVVTLLETLEGGDYFRFIEEAEGELRAFFPHVEVLQVGKRACWYICTPF